MKRLYTAIIVLFLAASLHVKTAPNTDQNYIRQLISQANPNIMINGTPLIIYVTMQLVRLDKANATEWHNMLTTLLQKQKLNVDVLDTKEYTALMYAAYYGHCTAAALLLNHGAQAAFYNKNGESALTTAYEGQKYASETQKKQYAQLIALLTSSTNRKART
jgi:ankyrin repeat protein